LHDSNPSAQATSSSPDALAPAQPPGAHRVEHAAHVVLSARFTKWLHRDVVAQTPLTRYERQIIDMCDIRRNSDRKSDVTLQKFTQRPGPFLLVARRYRLPKTLFALRLSQPVDFKSRDLTHARAIDSTRPEV